MIVRDKILDIDVQVLIWIGSWRDSSYDLAVMDFTAMASGVVITALASLIGLFLLSINKFREAVQLLIVTIGASLLYKVIEQFVQRERPKVIPTLIEARGEYSFPSGHALMGTAFYFTLYFITKRSLSDSFARQALLIFLLVLPILTGVSRLYIGIHFPTMLLPIFSDDKRTKFFVNLD